MEPTQYILENGIFYTNSRGNAGVSLDGRETLYNHVGRQIPVDEAVWNEEDGPVEISDAAARPALLAAEAKIAEAEFFAARERAAKEEAERIEAAEKARRAARLAWLRTPAGEAYQARQIESIRDLYRVIIGLSGGAR